MLSVVKKNQFLLSFVHAFFSLLIATLPQDCLAKPKLQKVALVRAKYILQQDRLLISWKLSPGASKYKITIKDDSGNQLASVKTDSLNAKFKAKLFSEGQELIVSIKAIGNSQILSSSVVEKSFTFSTRVATEKIYAYLKTTNSSGRKGVYFLPKNYRLKRLPAMLLLHGSSIDGNKIARIFREIASKDKFIIIAPDSVNDWGWEYSLDKNNPSEDQVHIENSIAEVLALPNISIDNEKLLVAGVSAGGELAAFIGSNDPKYKAIAVMHGGIYLPGIGENFVPIWLSTGTQDNLRPPSEVSGYLGILKARSFADVIYNEYETGHAVPDQEKSDLIEWWLGTSTSKEIISIR